MNSFIESFQKNKFGIILMVCSSLLVSLGQLFWKISDGANLIYLFLGFVLYGVGALFMVIAFKFGRFSILHPIISTSYIFAIFFGVFFLYEDFSLLKSVGTVLVLLGVMLIGGSDR